MAQLTCIWIQWQVGAVLAYAAENSVDTFLEPVLELSLALLDQDAAAMEADLPGEASHTLSLETWDSNRQWSAFGRRAGISQLLSRSRKQQATLEGQKTQQLLGNCQQESATNFSSPCEYLW